MGFLRRVVSALAGLSLVAQAEEIIKRASLQQVTNFGANTSGTKMFIYVPNAVKSNPAIVVAVHYCSGTAQVYYQTTDYARLSEQYGFIVIYPESPYSGTCWDVSSKAALTHNGGADSNSIANMVTYTLQKYNGDPSRVFVMGTSSGAMMTSVLAATYPEMFAAAIVYAGVPAGCFYTGTVNGWNSTCAQGRSVSTQQIWAQTVFNMYPGYTGKRPRMQIYHGNADTTIFPPNYNESIKQWTGVFGYSLTPQQTLPNTPSSPWTKYVYGENLQGIYGNGITHAIPIQAMEDLKWFGIIGGSTTPTTTKAPTSSTTRVSTPTTTQGSGGGCTVAQWGQCGGKGYTGCSTCASPFTCKTSNEWYSQCL